MILKRFKQYFVPETRVERGDVFDTVHIETKNLKLEDQNKPPGAVASKLMNGRPQVVIYNSNINLELFEKAKERAIKFREIMRFYPNGQYGYHLHTEKAPLAPDQMI